MTLELWARRRATTASAQLLLGRRPCAARARSRTRMGMPHLTLDLRDAFRAGVVDAVLAEHAAGLTPNPCVRCNGHVRFDAMLELARAARRARRSPPATTRASTGDGAGLLRAAADPAQGPDLHARRARARRRSRACASRSAS